MLVYYLHFYLEVKVRQETYKILGIAHGINVLDNEKN